MATIRVLCQKKVPMFWRIMYFWRQHYPIHVTVDGKNHKFNSKLGQYDIHVAPGVHHIRIGNYSEKAQKVTNVAGNMLWGAGAGGGSRNTAAVGAMTEGISTQMGTELGDINLAAGEIFELKVKMNMMQKVVLDK